MKKLLNAFLVILLSFGVMSACTTEKEKEEKTKKEPATSQPKEAEPNTTPSTPTPTPTPNPPVQTPTVPNNPPPAQQPTSPTNAELIKQYEIDQYITSFNQLGSAIDITLSNPSVFINNAELISFSIPVSNGCGMGIAFAKDGSHTIALSIVGPQNNAKDYDEFFLSVATMVQLKYPTLTQGELTEILNKLGMGQDAKNINASLNYQSEQMKVYYDGKSLVFQFVQTR